MSNWKWLPWMREFLFRTLNFRFGPYKSWDGVFPNNREEYDQCIKELAVFFSRETGKTFTEDAVALQIRWAVTLQTDVIEKCVVQYFQNKAIAHTSGFIGPEYLPTRMLVENKD